MEGSMNEMIAATTTTTKTASTTPTIPCGLRNCDIGRRYATDVFRRGCDVCRQHTNHRHEATGRSTNRPEFSESSSTFRRDPRRRTRDASPSSWILLLRLLLLLVPSLRSALPSLVLCGATTAQCREHPATLQGLFRCTRAVRHNEHRPGAPSQSMSLWHANCLGTIDDYYDEANELLLLQPVLRRRRLLL